ncbi:RNA-binding protein, partial [Bacillus mycoides]|nr:RNA-binding protein [Bacillus mycoides]
ILICKQNNPDLKHILLLAKEKNVPIEIYENMAYSCCGLIKPLRRETL